MYLYDMGTTNEQLTKAVMRRVYITHTLRQLTSPFAFKLYIFAILLWQMFLRVSPSHIFANASHMGDMGSLSTYISSAFSHTESLVQFGVFIALALAIWMSRDLIARKGLVLGT